MKSFWKQVIFCSGLWASLPADGAGAPASSRQLQVVVLVGAAGNAEYGSRFANEASLWQASCQKAGVPCETFGLAQEDPSQPDSSRLRTWLQGVVTTPGTALWMVLIGHGTFDGRDAKFNLRGPDLSPAELAGWLKPFTGELAVIQTASASAPFVKALAGPNRVLISATKSADEVFYTRFGQFFAQAVGGSKEPDLDHDGQVSLLEAFLWSSKEVNRFFEAEGRLATEHAIIEDSGDGVGTRAEGFAGLRPVGPPVEGQEADGRLARQWCLVLSQEDAMLGEARRKRRDELEREVEALRAKKSTFPLNTYYDRLEKLLLEIARLYQAAGSS